MKLKDFEMITPASKNDLTPRMKKLTVSLARTSLLPLKLHPAHPNGPCCHSMDTEDGEVLEALSTTKLAAFKADLTKTVVSEILGAMKDAGLTNLSTRHSTPRRPSPKVFSEHFDTTAHRQPAGPMSFAAAARQIARGDATPEHAARMVFRSTYPRSTIPGITNLYMRGYAEPGPLRYTIIRNALLTLGISTGVLDMSFIGKSVVHLLCDSSKAEFIQGRLTDKGVFLPAFDPLEVPDLVVSSSKSKEERAREGRQNCIKRLGGLFARGGTQIKSACLEGVDEEWQMRLEPKPRSLPKKKPNAMPPKYLVPQQCTPRMTEPLPYPAVL
ncbi:hypothetical protein BC829DRAFT_424250 [Chytridium lagenaria]|nr:hypothetical protein BC829DRAFT_424250 [Chytridium lagenaria]